MKVFSYKSEDKIGLGVLVEGKAYAVNTNQSLKELIEKNYFDKDSISKVLSPDSKPLDFDSLTLTPPVVNPGKIICVGMNYAEHVAEAGGDNKEEYPTLFVRLSSSLTAHKGQIIRPSVSEQLDFEGELVVVIGKKGKHIPKEKALDHVFGYSIFNDASIRDYQLKMPLLTMGKNFDRTGSFGPYIVTADEIPDGAANLKLETRLNGQVVQSANTKDLIFDVPYLISLISEGITLEPGDIIVTGTPSGVGWGRKPQLWMKPGDTCEVEIEKIGVLENNITDET
ncbi:fumarylacetoacetate hydrolase family protein [Epilithonimonas hungarica]|uniref:2-keto-4-pentenoate hydratase/2-oxohepta-3-ene-1,7-dioic acid hydratase (Catechol pathway) n=1 Tax=Epilithonimonas hungarica TaxID=454006 RepID=A0A1G7SAH7_9FLAO|nr:fumarylacetoacetate hydrolase family protein [Epilithonimonas hungarica]SDG20008.1 2-keto-4-pentenoate hydratase/2-oxohepta-3-ene-1,7-dioic acid hydratase (catechol pathway) [Epilithonimonas hungarica]